MGYSTDFIGSFTITPALKETDRVFLEKLSTTRRMARSIDGHGVEGEFYVDGDKYGMNYEDKTVIDHNRPPRTQPGLWCQWVPTEDGTKLVWDGGEKFYNYVEWLEYIINSILSKWGYTLNGEVEWQGEDRSDRGMIVVKDNKVKTRTGKFVYDDSCRPKTKTTFVAVVPTITLTPTTTFYIL